jgi:HSP20 family protein
MLQPYRNGSHLAPIATGSVNRIDALFNSLWGDDGGFLAQARSRFPIAMWEDDDHVYVEAELPGVAEQDVDVTVHNGTLWIRAERKPEEGRQFLYNGRSYGRFERVLTLPEAINSDVTEATLSNGVLSVRFAKAAEAKPKKLSLKSS